MLSLWNSHLATRISPFLSSVLNRSAESHLPPVCPHKVAARRVKAESFPLYVPSPVRMSRGGPEGQLGLVTPLPRGVATWKRADGSLNIITLSYITSSRAGFLHSHFSNKCAAAPCIHWQKRFLNKTIGVFQLIEFCPKHLIYCKLHSHVDAICMEWWTVLCFFFFNKKKKTLVSASQ